MSRLSRRKLITTGLAAAAGAAGLDMAARLAARYGLIPPDAGTLYGAGETLTYAAQRLVTRHTMAREFPRSMISKRPFADPTGPLGDKFEVLQRGGFADWRLVVDGMVAHPTSFTLDQLKGYPMTSQITFVACEEGWSYIAEWTGVRLSHILDLVGTAPKARFVVYTSVEPGVWDSLDMAEAMHPQTLLTLGMNGAELPVKFGGPLRLRVPRQLGYKSVKYIGRLTVTDDIKKFGKGLGSFEPDYGYAWYAGI